MRRKYYWVGVCMLLCLALLASATAWTHLATARYIRRLVLLEDLDRLREFVNSGGNVEIGTTVFGVSPLMYALLERKPRSYLELLKLGANPNLTCRIGVAVIDKASAESDPEWLRAALLAGGDPNLIVPDPYLRGKPYLPPLFWAIHEGRFENVKQLCDSGANLDATDRFGATPLSEAWGAGEFQIVHYLLERGANYNMPADQRRTFIERLKYAKPDFWKAYPGDKQEWCMKVLKWFADRGLDVKNAVWDGDRWRFPNGKSG